MNTNRADDKIKRERQSILIGFMYSNATLEQKKAVKTNGNYVYSQSIRTAIEMSSFSQRMLDAFFKVFKTQYQLTQSMINGEEEISIETLQKKLKVYEYNTKSKNKY